MNKLLLSLFFVFLSLSVFSQQPPGSCPNGQVILTSFCSEACVLCEPVNGLTFSNSETDLGEAPPDHCAPQLHNTQWLGFIANSTSLSMQINVFNCNQGDGLQIGLWQTLDCTSFTQVSNCIPSIPENTQGTINTNVPLEIGGIYFLVVDGAVGDICDFSINVLQGATGAPDITGQTAPIIGPPQVCPGGTASFTAPLVGASIYDWTINGQPVSYEPTLNFSQTVPGTYTVCVTPSNPCYSGDETCTTIEVVPLPPLFETATICNGDSYTVGTQSFSATGNYQVQTTTPEGCQQLVNLDLTVLDPIETNLEEEICQGEVFVVGGIPYAGTGSYSQTLVSALGCDSVVNLNLTVHPVEFIILNEAICEGESITVGSNTYSATGTYQNDLISSHGCDSTVVLVLQVFEPETIYIDTIICQGEFVNIGFAFFDMPGLYTLTEEGDGGCINSVTLNLDVSDPVTDLEMTICDGESIEIGSNSYNSTGNYTAILPSYLGCDSTINLDLTVETAITSTLDIDICDGEVYPFGGTDYGTTGSYQEVFTSAGGCDSTVTLNLTVNSIPPTNLNIEVCNGDSYTVGTSTYSATGTYQDVLTASNGCDSTINLNLTVNDLIETDLNEEICDGDSYTVGTSTYMDAGNYQDVLVAADGCDSIVNLNLTVFETPETPISVSICDGESYTIGSSTYSTTGMYTETLTANNGCDSIVTLDLTVNVIPPTELNIAICTGQTYTVGTSTYSTSGTYSDLLTSIDGCDSLVNLVLAVDDVLEESLTTTICEGESYTVGSSVYTETGSYSDAFVTADCCDSVFLLDLTVIEIEETFLTETICDGESFEVGTSSYTTSGSYQDVLIASTGCDSIVSLTLDVLDVPQTSLVESICDGETYSVGTSTYNTSGNYQDILVAANGCDSIIDLQLTVLNVPQTSLNEIICNGESYFVGASEYTTSGTYQDVLVAANGCDSIVDLQLTVQDISEVMLTELICEGESYEVGTSSYTTSGTYQDFLVSANGCDSIVTLELTVAEIPVTNIVTSICDGASITIGTSTYNTAGVYQDILVAATGCDSIVNLDLTITDFYEINLVENICDGESYSVGTSTYNTTGVYQNTFVAQDGCDSIVNLDLTVLPIPNTALTETICDGEIYMVGTSEYTTSGTYQDILTAVTGCDSIVDLVLTVNEVFQTDLVEEICDGESILVGTNSYTTSGVYQDMLVASNGCDSLVNLDLTVFEIPETNLIERVCFGDTYTVGTSEYMASGTYQDILTAVTGCDSIVNLELTVDALIETNLDEILCNGESYTVGTSTYSATGNYQDILVASDGCDSVINLSLEIRDLIETTLTETICEGETYTVGTSDYDQSGDYQDVLTSFTGCDSFVNLALTVVPIEYTALTESICEGETFTVGTSEYTTTGEYTDVLVGSTGCDSIVELDLFVIEILETELVETICDGESVSVGTSTYTTSGSYEDVLLASTGCDSIVSLELTVLEIPQTTLDIEICDGETYTVGTSDYTTTGNYEDILVAASGCDSIVSLNLIVNEVYETELTEAICEGESYEVGTNSFSTTGTFVEQLTSQEGCDSTVTLNLTVYPCQLSLNINDKEVSCNGDSDGSLSFDMTIGTPPYTYTWEAISSTASGSGTIEDNNLTTVIDNLPAGNYTITITDSYDIVEVVQATVIEPDPISIVLEPSEYGIYNTSCSYESDASISATISGGTAGYTYSWSTGGSSSSIDDLGAGDYELTVTDQNGCEAIANITLDAPPPLEASAVTVDPLCYGDLQGSIIVEEVNGGSGPYLYALDDGALGFANQFPSLGVGTYTVSVQDANGCMWEEEVSIDQPEELLVDLGDDITIGLGDSIQLDAITSEPVVSWKWDQEGLSCEDCLDPYVKPQESTVYSITVQNENGCEATDRITIFVNKERQVFIPNVFSPNNDGINDVFFINAGPDVVSVKSFLVFNRWGESMMELFNFQPNDPVYGWDGSHRGKALNPGVYVFLAEIEFIDGEVILYKGDVALMK
jgi:gliding motility-associated-like protein